MRRRAVAAASAATVGALLLGGCAGAGEPAAAPSTLERGDVGVQLFQLPWTAVAQECERVIGPAGYGWVLVSPAQEHIVAEPWWASYQPVSARIESRLGTRAEFAEMTARCAAAGVDVIADAVINHMSGRDQPSVGWAGSPYSHFEYPGLFDDGDFHHCGLTADDDIRDYTSREQVQSCELVNLADLDTASPHVRERIVALLTDLIDLGAAGVRIDAAKHIPADDVAAIVGALPDGTRVISEVIRSAREPIAPEEYTAFGEVFEFQYARDLWPQLESGLLADPELDGDRPAHVPSSAAVVFIDNHDTERGEADLTWRDGDAYVMAVALMLADDYGTPVVYSGYAFSDRDAGAPTDAAGRVLGTVCTGDAVGPAASGAAALEDGDRTCVHAWPQIRGMVELRRVAAGADRLPGVVAGDAFGFEREGRAVIAVNPGTEPAEIAVPTSLPDGRYCDVISGGPRIGVDGPCTGAVIEVAGGAARIALAAGATAATHRFATAP